MGQATFECPFHRPGATSTPAGEGLFPAQSNAYELAMTPCSSRPLPWKRAAIATLWPLAPRR
jgi:hypothetical protein